GDIDLIINGSGTQDQEIPDGGPLIQRALGLGDSGVPCFSVHTTCLGFVHALDIASVYFASGRHNNVLITNADMPSRALNYKQPESAVLFGDAGAAVVVRRPEGDALGVEYSLFETFGDGAELTQIRGGGSKTLPNDPATTFDDNLFDMDPLATFTFATRRFMRFAKRLLEETGEDVFREVDWIVPHQPSLKALKV